MGVLCKISSARIVGREGAPSFNGKAYQAHTFKSLWVPCTTYTMSTTRRTKGPQGFCSSTTGLGEYLHACVYIHGANITYWKFAQFSISHHGSFVLTKAVHVVCVHRLRVIRVHGAREARLHVGMLGSACAKQAHNSNPSMSYHGA